jgi:hypothetical protein
VIDKLKVLIKGANSRKVLFLVLAATCCVSRLTTLTTMSLAAKKAIKESLLPALQSASEKISQAAGKNIPIEFDLLQYKDNEKLLVTFQQLF